MTLDKVKHNKQLFGVLMMLINALSMSIFYMSNKLATQTIHPAQVAFLSKLFIFIGILPWCLSNGTKGIRTKKLGAHMARGSFAIMGKLCFLMALSGLSPTDVAALSYVENILIAIVGFLYFKEKVNTTKIMAFGLCIIAVFIIIKPSGFSINKYYIFMFMALGFWALNNTIIKVLGKTERTKTQLFYAMLFSLCISFPIALYEWQEVDISALKYVLISSVFHAVHTVAFFKAYKSADISTVMPIDYTRLFFTGILTYFVFGTIPDTYSIIGYVLIVVAGLGIFYTESKSSSSKKQTSISTAIEYKAK